MYTLTYSLEVTHYILSLFLGRRVIQIKVKHILRANHVSFMRVRGIHGPWHITTKSNLLIVQNHHLDIQELLVHPVIWRLQVDGHLQMWWCKVCSSANGGNDELLLLVSNAAFIQELSEGMHIGLYRPYASVTAGNVRVLLVPGEASVCLL
jgi:hypothetical protein